MSYSVLTDYRTTLAAPMTNTQLTITVNSILTNDAIPHTIITSDLGDGWYLMIAPGTAHEEVIKVTVVTPGSGDGGTFTIDVSGRGLAFYGRTDAQVAGNAYPHNPGDVVILSNVKNFENRLVDLESDQSIPGHKTFTEEVTVPINPSNATDAASKAYVDATITAAGGVMTGFVTQGTLTTDINVGSGYVIFGNVSGNYTGNTAVTMAANATNYVYLTAGLSLVHNTTGFPDGVIQLATITTNISGAITGIVDVRPFFTQPDTVQVITRAFTYGATIAIGDKLYLDAADGKWKLALATTAATADSLFGIALEAGVDTNTSKRVQIGGAVAVLTSLTAGFQYLTDAGGLSTTPGTYRKLVGFAPTSTTLILQTGIRPSDLSGVDSSVTATSLNMVGAFFATPLKQALKYTGTAGQDLAAGEVIAVESDGKFYRIRPTNFSTSNAGAETTLANVRIGTLGKMYWFDTTSSVIKCFLSDDTDFTPDDLSAIRFTVDNNFQDISSHATGQASLGAPFGVMDAVQHENSSQVTTVMRLDTGPVKAVSFNGLTTTPAFGSPITLDTASGAGITDTLTSGILVGFSDGGGAELRSYKITYSGTALTESTNASMLAVIGSQPYGAGRFTGTNFVAVVFKTSGGALQVIIGEYNPAAGTWTQTGTPVEIESSGMSGSEQAFVIPVSSTKMAVGYLKGSDFKVLVVTRSTVTATLSSILSAVTGSGTPNCCTMKKIGTYTFMVGEDTSGGGKLQLIALDRDFTAFSTVGSAITNGSASARGIAGCLLVPNRWLAIYETAAADSAAGTRELTTNLASMIGVIEAAVATNGSEEAIVEGYTASQTGLTAGSAYYSGIDGQLSTSNVGAITFSSTSGPLGVVKKVLTAYSATEGDVDV